MSKIIITLIICLIVIFIYEMVMSHLRQMDRRNIYILATRRAKQLGRKLIVIGDPHNGIGSGLYNLANYHPYKCNDIMIDYLPCKKCKSNKTCKVMDGDIVQMLQKLEDDKYVIFASGVLEYVPHIKESIKEINRVAGSSDNIFIFHVQPYSLIAYLYPGFLLGHENAKNIISNAPPYSDHIIFKKI